MEEKNKSHLFSSLSIDTKALYETELLDSDPEPVFDRLTSIAARALNVPLTLITLVDTNRQFFKSHCGLGEPLASQRGTALDYSFCQHVVVLEKPLVIPDVHTHPLVHNNLAVHELGVASYVGVPLTNGRGNIIGSLCALDFVKREWTESNIEVLTVLAAHCASEVDVRLTIAEHTQNLEVLHQVQREGQRVVRDTVRNLRASLTSLRLNLDILPLIGPINEDQKESLEFAQQSIGTLDQMLGTLLTGDGIDDAKKMNLNCAGYFLQDLVGSAVEQVSSLAAEKDIYVESDASCSLPAVSVDGEKLVRVIINLIGDTIASTPIGEGVYVTVQADNGEGRSGLVLTISSSGLQDISDSDLDSSLNDSNRLTGFDLTSCRSIVEAHGGQLKLDSKTDSGKNYTLSIPLER